MPRTTTYSDVLNLIRNNIPYKEEDYKAAQMCKVAVDLLWNSYDWRESIAVFPPFWLVPSQQDYGSPLAVIPADFQGFREAWLNNLASTPPQSSDLFVNRDVRVTQVYGLPSQIGYEPSKTAVRIFPRVPSNVAAPQWLITGTYKILPPTVTAATLQTATWPFDDQYLPVFIEVMKWAALQTSGAPLEKIGPQLGAAHSMIQYMAQNEGLELGDPQIAPAEPLVGGWSNTTGGALIFGGFL